MVISTYLRKKDEKHFGYVLYLSSELTLANQYESVAHVPTFIAVAVLVPVGLSLTLELYIGIRLRKLPWLSLRSVTLGHLVMGASV